MWMCMCKYNCALWHSIPLTRPVFYMYLVRLLHHCKPTLHHCKATLLLNEQVNHLSSTYLPEVSLCAEFKGHNSSLKVIFWFKGH